MFIFRLCFICFSGPEPKRVKPNPIQSETNQPADNLNPSSNLLEEPRNIDDLPQDQVNVEPVYHRYWHQICTRVGRQNRLLDWYNFRISTLNPQEFLQHLDPMFANQSTVFKLIVSFGFILQNIETGELRYHHSLKSNTRPLMPHSKYVTLVISDKSVTLYRILTYSNG